MKIKSHYLIPVIILFIGVVLWVLFFSNSTRGDLFSRSVNPITDNSITEGENPRPLAESLDTLTNESLQDNNEKRIQELQQELLEAVNDTEKAIELRHRIQLLKTQK